MDEKQVFTTFDSFSVLGLILLVLIVTGTIVSNSLMDQKSFRAQERANQLAYQILVGGLKTLPVDVPARYSHDRELASRNDEVEIKPDGRIGMDPWGRPYYYRAYKDADKHYSVVVFSSGPNQRKETGEENLVKTNGGQISHLVLQGDDIGALRRGI